MNGKRFTSLLAVVRVRYVLPMHESLVYFSLFWNVMPVLRMRHSVNRFYNGLQPENLIQFLICHDPDVGSYGEIYTNCE